MVKEYDEEMRKYKERVNKQNSSKLLEPASRLRRSLSGSKFMPKIHIVFILAIVIMTNFLFLCFAESISDSRAQIINTIADSHIQGNVPDPTDFNAFLERDLEKYFSKATGEPIKVSFEFLREGPTQTGISYPKYYLWVKLINNDKVINEGAVRVAAVEKKYFEVTKFLDLSEIKNGPELVYEVFPRPVGDKIRLKVNNMGRKGK